VKHQSIAWIALAAVASACAGIDNIEGRYAPACIAHEGNAVELSGGRFVWDKFTDAVEVDADGNEVDPFPGFPVRGNYDRDGQVVRLNTDIGDLAGDLHLVRHANRIYLLTRVEFERWQRDRRIDECALALAPGDD